MIAFADTLLAWQPNLVMGDVNSTLACILVAAILVPKLSAAAQEEQGKREKQPNEDTTGEDLLP